MTNVIQIETCINRKKELDFYRTELKRAKEKLWWLSKHIQTTEDIISKIEKEKLTPSS